MRPGAYYEPWSSSRAEKSKTSRGCTRALDVNRRLTAKSKIPRTRARRRPNSRRRSRTTIIYCDIPDSTLLLSKTPAARFHEWLDQCRREWSAAVEMNGGVVFHSHRDNVAAY